MNLSFNRLSSETSPYLLQHATNPVNWYPWGKEAIAKAEEENKLMLVSIGYSSCHWCHVMEKEAFSNPEVAEFMNNHYVCVKVDREERPDVDQIYMNAIQIITRSGGWPLNCFTLPNGKPVFGGTYFPTEAWLDILKSLHFTWMTEPKRVIEVAEELTQGISNSEIIKKKKDINEFSADYLKSYVDDWSKHFDTRYGAIKGAPKFVMPGSLQFLLDYSWAYRSEREKDHVKFTLDKVSLSGLYDQLGGGFFRYSVDEQWHVPHFEKMLYDNAQLVSLYTNAYKHFGDESYRSIVYQTIDFLRREMRASNGGFYSAIDADSEGEEGKYYTFSKADIDNFLGPDSELFSIVYGVTASGNHMGKNVLRLASSINETACLLGLAPEEVVERIKISKAKLLNARLTRVRPVTDDKQILSWNALVISALANAYLVFGDKRYISDALLTAQFIDDKLANEDGSLLRIHCKGKSSIPAFFDDYSFLIQAYIALYRATFNEDWLFKANTLVKYTLKNFFCNESGMFYFTSNSQDDIIVRKMELTDGVMPSSGAVMAKNLMELGAYFRDQSYVDMAQQMTANICAQIDRGGPYIYKWASIYLKHLVESAEVIAAGKSSNDSLRSIAGKSCHPLLIPYAYNPDSKLPMAKDSAVDVDSIKLCIKKTCMKPTINPLEVIESIEKERPYGFSQ